LLIMNGHFPHLTVEFIEFCFSHDIHLLCFLSHSTDLPQPLDIRIFWHLGRYYSNKVDNWSYAYQYQVVHKGDCFPLCQWACQKALIEANIKYAFAAPGIYPYSHNCILNILNS
ncbi:hypothetical protein C7212DRAFT_61755, partial [Tuber magnatum]